MASTNNIDLPSTGSGGTMALLNGLSVSPSNSSRAGTSQGSSSESVSPDNFRREAVLFIAPVLFGVVLMVLILGSVLHYRLKVRAKVAIICREFEKVDEALLKYRSLKESLNQREQQAPRTDGESIKTSESSTTSSNLDDDKHTQESTLSWDSDANRYSNSNNSNPSVTFCDHSQRSALARYQNQNRSYSIPLTKTQYSQAAGMLYGEHLEEEDEDNYVDSINGDNDFISYGVPVTKERVQKYETSDLNCNSTTQEEMKEIPAKNTRRDSQLSLQRERFKRQQPLYVGHDSMDCDDALSRRCQRFIRQDPILEPYSTAVLSTGTVFTITGSGQGSINDVTKNTHDMTTSSNLQYITHIESSDSLLP